MSAVELIVDGSMAELIMKRPEVLNSLDEQAVEEMSGALREAEASGVRGLLLRGEGRGFSAGRDLSTASPPYRRCVRDFVGGVQPLNRTVAKSADPDGGRCARPLSRCRVWSCNGLRRRPRCPKINTWFAICQYRMRP